MCLYDKNFEKKNKRKKTVVLFKQFCYNTRNGRLKYQGKETSHMPIPNDVDTQQAARFLPGPSTSLNENEISKLRDLVESKSGRDGL